MASTNSFHQFLVHILSKGRSGLIADYKTFKRVAEPGTYEAWCLPENYDNKNRYINVVCLDTTRVKLNDQDVNNDYIHANHIRIPHYPIAYIAAQGPLESTVVDFYRMIIQVWLSFIITSTKPFIYYLMELFL